MLESFRVAAVISSFNPPNDLLGKMERLSDQVDEIYVVDDGSTQPTAETFASLRGLGVEVIELGSNQGIAAALNTGIRRAISMTADMILTLDQDSELDEGYVEQALKAYAAAIASGVSVGIVCAESHNGLPVMMQEKTSEILEAFDPMQSGTLIPVSTIAAIGYFDEPLFIDCVDSEFTARLREAGMRAIIAPGCNITHAVGDARPMRLGPWHITVGGRKRFVHWHAPFRVYYITRNGIVLYRRFARNQPKWVLRRIGLETIFYAVRVVYGPHRLRQVFAMALGLIDALSGRMGRLTERQEALLRP